VLNKLLKWIYLISINVHFGIDSLKLILVIKVDVIFGLLIQNVPRKTGPTHPLSTNLHICEKPFPTSLVSFRSGL
jgi:hypothetical protein